MNNTYSYVSLFTEEVDFNKDTKVTISQIVIPKIQRPYAQGRPDEVCTYVRNTILDEIFDSIKEDKPIDLNFVYGIVRQANDSYVMELLDGQQRLTTLFLLHWYIVNRELQADAPEDLLIRSCLSKFVYETRSTSTLFCQKLADYRIDLSHATPKSAIRKAKWYFKSFDRDSTIRAMLTMLDAIHERYQNYGISNLHTKLQLIQFYVKSLGFFNLSEELYIKMNARGLQLSPFENFKADLTHFVSNHVAPVFQKPVPLYKKDSQGTVPFHMNFSIKLDAKWIDLFWRGGNDSFDVSYMSFFSRFFAYIYIVNTRNRISDRDMRSDSTIKELYTDAEKKLQKNEYLGFKEFYNLLNANTEHILLLDKVLDVLYECDCDNDRRDICKLFIPVWEQVENSLGDDFYCNIDSNMTQTKLIIFSAFIAFVEAYNTFDLITFSQWMRVVWNVVENTNIDSLTPTSSLIRKFWAVIMHTASLNETDSFYSALSKWKSSNADERENRALLEEVEKAKRIAENPQWESSFIAAESHPYFKGMIGFYYTNEISIEEFDRKSALVKDMFDKNGIAKDYRKKHILIRAIVSQHSNWEELNELYITERSETNKFLKNILASHKGVRQMFADVLSSSNELTVKDKLQSYIDAAVFTNPAYDVTNNDELYFPIAIDRLHNDVKMYDWIAKEEKTDKNYFRVYCYQGHIMFAVPRKQYAKLALDTERAKLAFHLKEAYGFTFSDEEQLNMFNAYGDCFGNEVWAKQEREKCTVWIGFCQHHNLNFQIECKTKKMANQLSEQFEESTIDTEDGRWLHLLSIKHSSVRKTKKKLQERIEEIFDLIPEK